MSSIITPGQSARRLLPSFTSRCIFLYHQTSTPAHSVLIEPVNKPRSQPFAQKVRPARPSPSLSIAPRLSAKGEPPRWIFSPSDVPPIKDWTNGIEALGAKHLTPLQCMEAAQRYVSAATQHESSWRPRLQTDFDLPVSLLHWVGILLIAENTPARWRLGTHMLRSASELGYDPSMLTLMRIFSSMPDAMLKKVTASKMFIDADARFQRLLKRGTSPDALTLEGIILAKQGTRSHDRLALESFRKAEKAWEAKANPGSDPSPASGSRELSIEEAADPEYVSLPDPREPRWEWEVSWALGQANILQSKGATEEARELYHAAALELDNPLGFWNLANLMHGPRDSPERRTYLLKAAISGVQEACRELGELEKMAAEREGLSDKDRADRGMMSQEWFRLADGEDLKSIQNEDED